MREVLILGIDISEHDVPTITVSVPNAPIGVIAINTIQGDDALDIYKKLTNKEND